MPLPLLLHTFEYCLPPELPGLSYLILDQLLSLPPLPLDLVPPGGLVPLLPVDELLLLGLHPLYESVRVVIGLGIGADLHVLVEFAGRVVVRELCDFAVELFYVLQDVPALVF